MSFCVRCGNTYHECECERSGYVEHMRHERSLSRLGRVVMLAASYRRIHGYGVKRAIMAAAQHVRLEAKLPVHTRRFG